MIFRILIALSLASCISSANSKSIPNKLSPQNGPAIEINPRWIKIKDSEQNANKGTLFLDPVSCQFNLLKDTLKVSLKDNNFLVEFPDGRTVVGVIENTNNTNRPPCFHSLTKPPQKSLYRITANNMENGMLNCLARESTTEPTTTATNISDELFYLTTEEYLANCAKDSSACRKNERTVKISNGAGLIFFSSHGNQSGSNISRSDLQLDEKLRNKCDVPITPKGRDRDDKPSKKLI